MQLLHHVIADHIAASPGIRLKGKRQGDGYVYLLDGRTPSSRARVASINRPIGNPVPVTTPAKIVATSRPELGMAVHR